MFKYVKTVFILVIIIGVLIFFIRNWESLWDLIKDLPDSEFFRSL